ncbi:MAG: SDR family oxidoreductase [Bacteroidota bacterium]
MTLSDNSSKQVLLTGGTSGIGRETVRALATKGFRVAFTARDLKAGYTFAEELKKETGNTHIEVYLADLASFASIRNFVTAFTAQHSKLDVLINNAGTWETERSLSKDGIETTIAVNHLAPFLLTNLLLPLLIKSAPARIVIVASALYINGEINLADPQLKQNWGGVKAYSNSKLMNIYFMRELHKKLKGTGVTVNALHPGVVNTSLSRKLNFIMRWFFETFTISAAKGAKTTVYLASDPHAEGVSGEYFVKSKPEKLRAKATDDTVAAALWQMSEKYTGIKQ